MVENQLQARGEVLDDGVLQRSVAEARAVLAALDVERVLFQNRRVDADGDGRVYARALLADVRGAQD